MERISFFLHHLTRKLKFIYSLAVLLLAVVLIWLFVLAYPDNQLHLVFCDVGQGDAILVSKGFTQVLIDGGPNSKVLQCLSGHLPFWDKKLELVVLTHPEYDHLTGLVSVAQNYQIGQLIANSLVTETGIFSEFRQEVIAKKIPVYSPKAGEKIKIGDLELKILYPQEKLGNEIVWQKPESYQVLGISAYGGNLNQTAIVSELIFGQFRALLTGDIGTGEEEKLEAEPIQVLKVAHHGSKYSTAEDFLERIKPALAVISVGASNKYGHPTAEVLQRLRDLEIKILRTDIDGEVEITSDGKKWGVRK
jgi:competence protein ComEC